MKKFYLIAGEPSGDLHGAHLIDALKVSFPDAEFYGFGGEKMQKAGLEIHQSIDQLSFMGFSEVIANLGIIRRNFKLAKAKIQEIQPHAIIYIDFPGFNMRMAKWSHAKGFKNYYYIAPQAWAWKPKRALALKKHIDQLFCILPFEKAFFAKYDYQVNYVGHPLVDIIDQYRKEDNTKINIESDKKIIALLPGSRRQEVEKILPIQLQAAQMMKDYDIYIAKASHLPSGLYEDLISSYNVEAIIYHGKTYDLLSSATLACVTSGTATLETALFKVPEVICYKGSQISYEIAKRLINIKYIGLANLIMDKEIVKELIQAECTVNRLYEELKKLEDLEILNTLQEEYKILEVKLGVGGAAKKTVEVIVQDLNRNFEKIK
ncbi:lipid-A-disaccharide synthase [Membranihabitans marinus]|uniref:lipid-A-disaccharide synthase n=1 Tax=Membranihabitans marinus TaxID=1227546 RepID=UPI001EFF70E4|nr:lipid-A-disaccharide synthase [Membranihabitans marinus]